MSSYYCSTIKSFLEEDDQSILDKMLVCEPHSSGEQIGAWKDTITILKKQLSCDMDGKLCFEYTIPRINRRIDALLFYKNIIFVLEFKCGMKTYCKETYEQVIDYAYDLHFFHELSEDKLVVPVELPTDAPDVDFEIVEEDRVIMPIPCNKNNISRVIKEVTNRYPDEKSFDIDEWLNGDYKPTPTIIEAARVLFNEHTVDNIRKHNSTNLTDTIETLNEIIEDCRVHKKKAICFVTGVPGAGKTLVGLTIAIQNMDENNEEHSVFLSGNAPLVHTLVEALARDKCERDKVPKYKAIEAAKSFIQGIHKFRLNGIIHPEKAPVEHVVIFDEAQRAWNHDKLKKFVTSGRSMLQYRIRDYQYSEPESLIMDMDRHDDWATIICLVGGGQEIYEGEAGLAEWFRALRTIKGWEVYVTPELSDSEYIRDGKWGEMTETLDVHEFDSLHLSVSMRTLRTNLLNNFVKLLLDLHPSEAADCYKQLGRKYPIVMTRNLDAAKNWIVATSGDCDRYGMIASSNTEHSLSFGALEDKEVPGWFLDDKTKPTSSYQFNRAASQFDIQGLELDYTILQWGIDFRIVNGSWDYNYWKWKNWKNEPVKMNDDGSENLSFDQLYLKNTYRVLMTRARKGMVLYIPKGDKSNLNDLPDYYEGTYNYLKSIGIEEIF